MPDQSVHLDSSRVLWVAPLTVAASVVAVLAVRTAAAHIRTYF